MRILHIGDIHPQAAGTYAGKLKIDPTTGYSIALTDCRLGLKACLDWERDHPCDLTVIGGDLWNTPHPTVAELAIVHEFIRQLLIRMPVVIVAGNHDMEVNGLKVTALEPLRTLAKLMRDVSGPQSLHIMTAPDRALVMTGAGLACVAGLPYPSKGRFQASAEEQGDGPEVLMAKMNASIRLVVETMNGGLHRTAVNVFIGHGTVGSAQIGEQPRSISHDLMIPVDALDRYDYVALNHIHKSQQVGPNAWYSGSLLCQSFGEKDEPKGWCVAEVNKGQAPQVTHIPNPHSRQFRDLTIAEVTQNVRGDTEVSPDAVYRVVGDIAEADDPEACLAIAKFEATHPFTQNALTIRRAEERARDAGMTSVLSEEEAVERVLLTVAPEESIPSVMQKHADIRKEVAA